MYNRFGVYSTSYCQFPFKTILTTANSWEIVFRIYARFFFHFPICFHSIRWKNVLGGQIKIETYCFSSKGEQINLNIFSANGISSNKEEKRTKKTNIRLFLSTWCDLPQKRKAWLSIYNKDPFLTLKELSSKKRKCPHKFFCKQNVCRNCLFLLNFLWFRVGDVINKMLDLFTLTFWRNCSISLSFLNVVKQWVLYIPIKWKYLKEPFEKYVQYLEIVLK